MMTNTEETNSYDYESGQGKASIRVSALPHHIQASAAKMDTDQDGALVAEDIATVISDLDKKNKVNRLLRKAIVTFVVVCFLLIAGVFGASITAARLSQDITVDHENGLAYVKGSDFEVMKTSDAVYYEEGASVGLMSNEQLRTLKEIYLEEGSLRFQVKGHARDLNENVILLVEGGTITYDLEGIIDVRGDAKHMFEAMYGPLDGNQRKLLYSACNFGAFSVFSY